MVILLRGKEDFKRRLHGYFIVRQGGFQEASPWLFY